MREFFQNIPQRYIESISIDKKITELRDTYISLQVVSKNYINDAELIAAATVSKVDIIVSWNFKHIVNFQKIKEYNGVNLLKGYTPMDIRSPLEVIEIV